MRVSSITETVTISHERLFNLFVGAIYGDAKTSTGKNRTLYAAFGCLVGISDADAVKMANDNVKKEYHITVTEFRRWLPTVFAEFARATLEANDEKAR